ncbi:hypothetical protein HWV62_6887, partial [Athelia sp. TMB]
MPRHQRRIPSETEESEGGGEPPAPKSYALRSRHKDIPDIPLPTTARRGRSKSATTDNESPPSDVPSTTKETRVPDVEDVGRPVVKSRKKHVATGSAGPNFGPGGRKGKKKRVPETASTGGAALSPLLEDSSVSSAPLASQVADSAAPEPRRPVTPPPASRLSTSRHFASIGREFLPPIEENTATPFKSVDYASRASLATRLLSSIAEPYVRRGSSLPNNSSPLTALETSPQHRSSSVPAVASRRGRTEEPVIPALNLIRASASRSSFGPSDHAFDVDAFSTPVVPGYASSEDGPLPRQPSKVATFRPRPPPKNALTSARAPSPLCSPSIAVLDSHGRSPESSDGDEEHVRAEIEEQDELTHDGVEAGVSDVEDAEDDRSTPQDKAPCVPHAEPAASVVEHPDPDLLEELVGEGADDDSSDADPSYQSPSQIAAGKAQRQQKQQDAWARSKEAVGAQGKASNTGSRKAVESRTEPDDE